MRIHASNKPYVFSNFLWISKYLYAHLKFLSFLFIFYLIMLAAAVLWDWRPFWLAANCTMNYCSQTTNYKTGSFLAVKYISLASRIATSWQVYFFNPLCRYRESASQQLASSEAEFFLLPVSPASKLSLKNFLLSVKLS